MSAAGPAERFAFTAPLFVPGDRPERIAKAAASGADAVIVDLEDAVAANAKQAARAGLAAAGRLPVVTLVRVNGHGTPWFEDDLALVAGLDVDAVMLPKADDAALLARMAARLSGKALVPLVESAAGIAAARALATAEGSARLAFGSVDFAADLGAAHTRPALAAARGELVLASRLAGLAGPVDGVTLTLEADETEADARFAWELGFAGKLCIHPRQVAPVLRGFAPAEREVAWAREVLALGDAGAVMHDGQMVDGAIQARARNILHRAERAGMTAA